MKPVTQNTTRKNSLKLFRLLWRKLQVEDTPLVAGVVPVRMGIMEEHHSNLLEK